MMDCVKKNFNSEEMNELKRIKNILKKDKNVFGMKLLRKFVDRYPDNPFARFEYAILLNKFEEYECALYEFDCIMIYFDYFEQNEREKIILELITTYYNLEKYNEVLSIVENHKYKMYNNRINEYISNFYLQTRIKLGLLKINDIEYDKLSYSNKQLIRYDESLALEHIKKHSIKERISPDLAVFSENIDINKLFYLIKDNINNSAHNYRCGLMDVYQFNYTNAGENRDFVQAVVLQGTNKIITMYPTEKVWYTVNNLIDKNINKVKCKSQIYKFNKKYGK